MRIILRCCVGACENAYFCVCVCACECSVCVYACVHASMYVCVWAYEHVYSMYIAFIYHVYSMYICVNTARGLCRGATTWLSTAFALCACCSLWPSSGRPHICAAAHEHGAPADVSCASSSKSISEFDGRARVGVSASCPSANSQKVSSLLN